MDERKNILTQEQVDKLVSENMKVKRQERKFANLHNQTVFLVFYDKDKYFPDRGEDIAVFALFAHMRDFRKTLNERGIRNRMIQRKIH